MIMKIIRKIRDGERRIVFGIGVWIAKNSGFKENLMFLQESDLQIMNEEVLKTAKTIDMLNSKIVALSNDNSRLADELNLVRDNTEKANDEVQTFKANMDGLLKMLPETSRNLIPLALGLIKEQDLISAPGTSGEYKRHRVYARLIKINPEIKSREIALAIELAINGYN